MTAFTFYNSLRYLSVKLTEIKASNASAFYWMNIGIARGSWVFGIIWYLPTDDARLLLGFKILPLYYASLLVEDALFSVLGNYYDF